MEREFGTMEELGFRFQSIDLRRLEEGKKDLE